MKTLSTDDLARIICQHSFFRIQRGFHIICKCHCGYTVTVDTENERYIAEARHQAGNIAKELESEPEIHEAEIVDE